MLKTSLKKIFDTKNGFHVDEPSPQLYKENLANFTNELRLLIEYSVDRAEHIYGLPNDWQDRQLALIQSQRILHNQYFVMVPRPFDVDFPSDHLFKSVLPVDDLPEERDWLLNHLNKVLHERRLEKRKTYLKLDFHEWVAQDTVV